ncbi:MAG: aldo/keto reductase [Trueperaceae bacterium]
MSLDWVDNVVIGCWQLSEGHTTRSLSGPNVLEAYYHAGFRVFDCADIYTGVESLLGEFIAAHQLGAEDIKVHTKYVPDLASLATLTPDQTERVIDRSRSRLGLDRLDLIQFHWWDYEVPGYLETLDTLVELKRDGKIREIGLTNFDAERLAEMVARDIPIASIQTQYSVLDRRPASSLAALAEENAIALLCYGSVAGGLLSDRFLGAPKPEQPFENRSLAKYLPIVEEIGSWSALQQLLRVMREIADEKETDIASVAAAYSSGRDGVRACIIGVRHTGHLQRHLALREGIMLEQGDLARIESVRRNFREVPGSVYELERDVDGKHNKIMKFNLNAGPA